jgi:hypothetical protein
MDKENRNIENFLFYRETSREAKTTEPAAQAAGR